ncbi:hypothetical protein ColKHC_13935 [Colletotrichum higginsianum]|nr:hypothetical protein ColKHC_13935 [Colletotrichum higginsianum]
MSKRYETVVLSSEVNITLSIFSIFSIFPIRLATLNDLRSLLKEFVTLEMERIVVYTWKSLLVYYSVINMMLFLPSTILMPHNAS